MTNYNVPVLRDFSWQVPVEDKDLTTPPGGESKGDRYIVKADGGDWSGHTTHIAMANQDNPSEAAHWIFATPEEGWVVWVKDEDTLYYFDGSSWSSTVDFSSVNAALSSMILTGGEVSEGSNVGTIKVAALTAMLRTGAGASDPLVKISLGEQNNIGLAAADIWYKIRLTYGSPCTIATSAESGNGANIIGIGHCLKEDDDAMHYSCAGLRLTDGVRKLHSRASNLREIEISSGGLVSDPGTRNLSITAGIFYRGINKYTTSLLSTLDSGVWFDYYYWNEEGSTWVKDDNGGAGYTQIDNVQYNKVDSGTGLANLANNKYTTNWIFLHPDDEDILVAYGRSYTKLTNAENEEIPPSLPDILDEMAVLLCKVIVQQGSDTLIFENVKYFTFTPQVVVDHNELSGLQGGIADEYYHLTSAHHTDVGLNTTHRSSDGSDHSKVTNNETAIALNTTHRGLEAGNPHIVTPAELSLVIGTNTQAYDAGLDSLAGLGYVSDSMIKITAEDTYAIRTMAQVLSDIGAAASGHNHDATYQPLDAALTDIADVGIVGEDSEFLVGTAAGALAWENAATAKTSIGLGNVENTQLSTWAGTTNITTLGTITTVGNITIADGGTIGNGVQLIFDDTNDFLEITGCKVGIGTSDPTQPLDVEGTADVLGDSRRVVELSDDTAMAAGVGAGISFGGKWNVAGALTRFAGIWAEKENGDDGNFSGQLHFGTRINAGTISSDVIIDSLGNTGAGTIPVTRLTVEGALTLKEQAAADGDTAAYGQVWVDNSDPCLLRFTNDVGGDFYAVVSDAGTGGVDSAGVGNQYVEMEIAGLVYKVLHDGTV